MQKSTHTGEYSALCRELRALREAAHLTQRDLAAKLNVPHSWVAKVEAGERRIDIVELCWFAAACGAEPVATFERLARQIPVSKWRRGAKGDRSK